MATTNKILIYSSLGTNHYILILTCNYGSVTPSSATRAELLAGKSITFDTRATTITVSGTQTCSGYNDTIQTGYTTTTTTGGAYTPFPE